MDIFIGIIIGFLVLMFLVIIHEFGHFIAARKNGITVTEFGIGLPPRAIAWTKGKDGKWHKIPKSQWQPMGTKTDSLIISLNWLPLGGFCQMLGESGSDKRPHTFGASSFLAKTKVLFAGVAMNWLFAIIIFTVLAWTGMPTFINNQFTIKSDEHRADSTIIIGKIMEGSPAETAGFQPGDQIISIDGTHIANLDDMDTANEKNAGKDVVYTVSRPLTCDDCTEEHYITKDILVTLNSADSDYLLGIVLNVSSPLARYTWSAPIMGIGTTAQLTGETFYGVGKALWDLVSGTVRQVSFNETVREEGREALASAANSVSGPIGILGILFPAFVADGVSSLAFLAALISVSLACMNVLPIPALDGGRWLMFFICKLKHKTLSEEREASIVGKTFLGLIIFMIIITIIDIIRFF